MDSNHTPLQKDDKIKPTTAAPTKESEPVGATPSEYLKPIEEPELNPEVMEYMKKTDESMKKKIEPALKELGVTSSDSSQGSVGPTFTLSDDKIEEGLHKPVSSSWRWLSEMFVYHLKQMHITLKKVHGHIVRVARG